MDIKRKGAVTFQRYTNKYVCLEIDIELGNEHKVYFIFIVHFREEGNIYFSFL